MSSWIIKAAVQRTIAGMPFSHKLNEWFQRYCTKSLELHQGRFEAKLVEIDKVTQDYVAHGHGSLNQPYRVFELGTGWHPTMPVGLFLCGAGEITTCDIAPLLSPERVMEVYQRFCDYDASGKLIEFLPNMQPERMARLREITASGQGKSVDELLAAIDTKVLVQDAQQTGLPADSVDLLVSIGVLSHLPVPVLEGMLREFSRIGTQNYFGIHYIDLSDLFHYFDPKIGPYHFLKYSDRTWSWIDNSIIPQNRLRVTDYREIFNRMNLAIVDQHPIFGKPEDLDRYQVDARFQNIEREDLLTIEVWLSTLPASKANNPAPQAAPNLSKAST